MYFFTYLRSVINENSPDSRKGFALVLAVLSLSIATIILAIAACFGQEVSTALATVSVPLAGLAGHSYVAGKKAEASQSTES